MGRLRGEVMPMRQTDANTREATENVASSTECTGLVPALNGDAAEANERRLYGVHRAKRRETAEPMIRAERFRRRG